MFCSLPRVLLRRASTLAAFFFIGISASALFSATELHFRNGDRLTGEVILREDGKIVFRSPILGQITVSETDAVVVELPDAPVESLAGLPPTIAESSAAPAAPPKSAAPPAPLPAAKVAEAPKPAPAPAAAAVPAIGRPKATWKGKLEFGFINQSGRRERMDLSFRADAEKKSGRNQYRGEIRYLYAKSNGSLASDRHDALARWRHDLTERLFSQSVTSYYADEIKQVDLNLEQNAGMGYKVFDRPHHVVTMGGGLTAQYRRSSISQDGWAYLLEAFQDYTWKLNGRLTLLQNANAFYSPEEHNSRNLLASSSSATSAGNYRLRFNSTLQGRVTERVSMNIRYEFEHDATIADSELRDDMRVTSSIGYAF